MTFSSNRLLLASRRSILLHLSRVNNPPSPAVESFASAASFSSAASPISAPRFKRIVKAGGSLFPVPSTHTWHCPFSNNCSRRYSHSSAMSQQNALFRQLFEHKSFTYTYIIGCQKSKEAVLIDPVFEMVGRDERLVKQLGLNLKYAVNTHVHADHITGSGKLKEIFPGCKSVLGSESGAKADLYLSQGDTLKFGELELEARATPGHTNGCMTYVWHGAKIAFSGDAVLIRGCGRTDFQQGSASRLYDSVHSQIFSLPDDFMIYPAHDYTGQPWTTVSEEKELNPRLSKPKDRFIEIMKNLNLPYPKQIDRALPANLVCGIFDEADLPPAK